MTEQPDRRWQILSELLDQGLPLSAAERAAWLASIGRADPDSALRIDALLKGSAQHAFADFLAGPPPVPVTQIATATLLGRKVGRYVIDAEIGRGRLGSTWRAATADGKEQVAIKLLHTTWIGRAGDRGFQAEGRLLGLLEHPSIGRLLDAGVLDGTQPYLVLEYIEGLPIDAYCAKVGLSAAGRIRLFMNVLDALGHAHTHLIAHQNVKPENVLITEDGRVKVLDLGITRLLDRNALATLAESSAAAATPQFIAPEQLLKQPITTAADVYSAALLLYTLLTGTPPFPTRLMLTANPPPASSVAGIASIGRETLCGDLDAILGKALRADPHSRYVSIHAFADDLRRHLTHRPVHAREDSLAYRTKKFFMRVGRFAQPRTVNS